MSCCSWNLQVWKANTEDASLENDSLGGNLFNNILYAQISIPWALCYFPPHPFCMNSGNFFGQVGNIAK